MKIKELRIKSKYSQQEIAKYLNTSQSNYSKYELGTTQINIDTLIQLANFFHVSVDYLIGNEQFKKIDLTSLSDIKKDCIQEIQSMTDDEVLAVTHFIAGLKQKEFIIKGDKNL